MASPDSPAQPKPTRKELLHKQQLFVEHYLGTARGNGTKAATLAGYACPAEAAYENLRKPHIRARIDERLAEVAMSANEVLAELSDIARAPWKEFVQVLEWDEDGKPLSVRMDLRSKVDALELMGKHHQVFTENVNLGGGIQIEIVGVDASKL